MEQVHTLFTLLFTVEKLMAQLYTYFALRYTGFSEFWDKLAAEEEIHAKLVKSLLKRAHAGEVTCQVDLEELAKLSDFVDKFQKLFDAIKAYPDALTFEDAIRMTATLENGIAEDKERFISSADFTTLRTLNQLRSAESGAHGQRVKLLANEYDISLDHIEHTIGELLQKVERRVILMQKEVLNRVVEKSEPLIPAVDEVAGDPPIFCENSVDVTMDKAQKEVQDENRSAGFMQSVIRIMNTPIANLVTKDPKDLLIEKLEMENADLKENVATLKRALALMCESTKE